MKFSQLLARDRSQPMIIYNYIMLKSSAKLFEKEKKTLRTGKSKVCHILAKTPLALIKIYIPRNYVVVVAIITYYSPEQFY